MHAAGHILLRRMKSCTVHLASGSSGSCRYVIDTAADCVWLAVSPAVRGRLHALDCCDAPQDMPGFAAGFQLGQKLRCHVLKVCSITESEHAQVADAWLLLLSMTDAWFYISFWTVESPLLSTPMPTLTLALHIGDRPMLAKHSVSCAQPSAKSAQKSAAWDVE